MDMPKDTVFKPDVKTADADFKFQILDLDFPYVLVWSATTVLLLRSVVLRNETLVALHPAEKTKRPATLAPIYILHFEF